MAITHSDLEPSHRSTEFGSKTWAFLVVLISLCGLFCFILCLIAEALRSEVTWVGTGNKGSEGKYECVYSGSGKIPLFCAAAAFVGLAVAMVVEHTYMLIAVTISPPSALVTWDPDSAPVKSLTWLAGFFFVSTWICFSIAEILLLIGLSVESGHLKNWNTPRPSCLIIREGLFSAAGVFSLTTVFLAAGLYLTALRAERISRELESVRREMVERSILYASPPSSPPHHMATMTRENPITAENHTQPPLFVFPQALSKNSNAV
ncbi:uncharacterized protein LOC122318360 [Carya illinoinensis]|uniref:Transmembrane protein n=1 Tax=Carya illinoinensis TaxID=32201 RepID=A0A8T1RMI8_CARIL|nr:uncharacterized protein LOC122318360 [Carya illinoinensis]KAG6668028.1 hypothetical protein CIPAW_01G142400 [Carya illinoinensis]